MPTALLANTTIAGGTAGGTSSSIDTTGATLLVIVISQQGTNVTVSDNKSNSWTGLTTQGSTPRGRIFYAAGGAVGTGHTFTISGASTFSAGCVLAFSGVTASPFESENGANTSSSVTSLATGSVTPNEAGALIVAGSQGGSGFSGSGETINASFIKTDGLNYIPSSAYGVAAAYLIQSTAAAVNPTWTGNSSIGRSAEIAVFHATGAALPSLQARVMVLA